MTSTTFTGYWTNFTFIWKDYQQNAELSWRIDMHRGQLTDAFLRSCASQCETSFFPVFPCDRLNYKTLHIAKSKWTTMDIPITTWRRVFCWLFGPLSQTQQWMQKTNIVAEHWARLGLNMRGEKSKFIKVNSTRTPSVTLVDEAKQEVDHVTCMWNT